MTIRVVVVDDQEIVRAGFAALLGTQADFSVVGTAADGEEAVEVCRTGRPHVVLMDVRMPVVDGMRPRGGHGRRRVHRVIVLTTFDPTSTSTTLGAGRADSCSRT
jgi:DNA-binding NarL/FixJ family response regulator